MRSAVFDHRVKAAKRFEEKHARTIRDFNFERGNLVLLRNTAIEKSLNRKMRPRYLGPFVVVSRNRGGAYIVADLNGAVFDRPIAAFRLIPYHARESIEVPLEALDIDTAQLRAMENVDSPPDETDAIIDVDDVELAEDAEGLPVE